MKWFTKETMTLPQKISADNFRFLEDVTRAIEKYSTDLDDLLNLQKVYVKQTAAMFLEVNLKGPKLSPKIEPTGNSQIKISSLEKLRKNYVVIRELWDTREELERLIVRVRQTFEHRGDDTKKAVAEIEKLKKKANDGLTEAFEFVSKLANENLPEKFRAFNEATAKIVQKSIAYEDSKQFTYVHEVEGDLVYSTYTQLLRVQDDDGTYYPELYIVTSYRTGSTSEQGSYVAILNKFVPPSDRLLMKHVSTVKETVRALNMLLALDNFTTSLGSLPIALMLQDSKGGIDRELFLYQNYVKSIRVDEEQVVIVLKPEIQDKDIADKIIHQMFLDFKGVVEKTKARVRMAVKKAEKCFVLTFFFVTANDTLLATEDDLSFLKERFNLSDTTLKNVVRTINQGQ